MTKGVVDTDEQIGLRMVLTLQMSMKKQELKKLVTPSLYVQKADQWEFLEKMPQGQRKKTIVPVVDFLYARAKRTCTVNSKKLFL